MDGVVVLLKPPGMTSSNAVYDVRRIFSEKRAGHIGTLDPGAAGVLPICIGRATRLFDLFVEKEKTYIAELAFGASTDTQDASGAVLARSDRSISREMLLGALPAFLGEIRQVAPAYSALKVDGRKMYDLARAGEAVPERVRTAVVHELTLLDEIAPNRFLLRVRCSRGTYVRTLCSDIGRALDMPAHMSFLLRAAAGPFLIDRSVTVGELEARRRAGTLLQAVVPCEEALAFLPELELGARRRTPAMNGLPTSTDAPEGPVRLYAGGAFLGVGRVSGHEVRLAVHLY